MCSAGSGQSCEDVSDKSYGHGPRQCNGQDKHPLSSVGETLCATNLCLNLTFGSYSTHGLSVCIARRFTFCNLKVGAIILYSEPESSELNADELSVRRASNK